MEVGGGRGDARLRRDGGWMVGQQSNKQSVMEIKAYCGSGALTMNSLRTGNHIHTCTHIHKITHTFLTTKKSI